MNITPINSVEYETFPTEIRRYLIDAGVTIIKNNSRSSVYHIKGPVHDYFLKVTSKDQMNCEAIMTNFLYNFGICPKVVHYVSNDTNDFFVTERLTGSDAASDEYLEQPGHLSEVFAESLLSLHRVQPVNCPITNGLEEMVIRAERKYREGGVEKGLLRYLGYSNIKVAYEDMISLFKNSTEDRVVIHGDYCLPNLILQDFKMTGYIDVGYGGIGDRHYDIFWGLWSLQFNLRSDDYSKQFVKAYGKHLIDQDRLRLCGLLSAFNGFRGQDYYEK
ncbi:aminoglycoside 3'-phosphotransferase [Paenibacillus lautus]|uniref:aminoglycoside 3'-phosphotransferase n=1 Tax=Paenibacillus lautus TaxID=1401 RepID=UPI000FD76B74|nr:aminoglycoside 3'-phosphotransferase [Paenibacillus lautus]